MRHLYSPMQILAQAQMCSSQTGNGTLNTFLTNIEGWLIGAGAIAVTIALIWAGYQFLNAGGSPQEMEKAKTTLRNAIIGAFLIFGASLLVTPIQTAVCGG